MEKTLIVGLHGFLGKGQDWKPLSEAVRKEAYLLNLEFWFPDLLTPRSTLSPDLSFSTWIQKFSNELDHMEYNRCVLMGYSMGGRLALHALIKHPRLFDGAIFFSTNPLPPPDEEMESRRKNDEDWARRFATENWETLLEDWDKQPVFAGEKCHPSRSEDKYSRRFLSEALVNWSLCNHEVTLNDLQKLKAPTLWFVGERDNKFLAIVNFMKQRGIPADFQVVQDRAHRLGFTDNPEIVEKLVHFLNSL